MMWHSLRFRLLLATILVVLIAVGVTAFVASRQTTGQFQRYVEERGDSRYRRFAGLLGRSYEMNLRWDDLQPEVERLGQAGRSAGAWSPTHRTRSSTIPSAR